MASEVSVTQGIELNPSASAIRLTAATWPYRDRSRLGPSRTVVPQLPRSVVRALRRWEKAGASIGARARAAGSLAGEKEPQRGGQVWSFADDGSPSSVIRAFADPAVASELGTGCSTLVSGAATNAQQ